MSGERFSRLVSAKTRIAPIGGETVPRLELLEALILARLMTSVEKALSKNLEFRNCVYWSDSQIALWLIYSENKTLSCTAGV